MFEVRVNVLKATIRLQKKNVKTVKKKVLIAKYNKY